MKLATLDDLISFGDYNDNYSKVELLLALESVSQVIQSHCNRDFEKSEDTDYFTTDYNHFFQLERYPVANAETFSVTLNLTGYWADQDINDDFTLDPDEGFVEFFEDLFPNEPRNLKVLYTGGYAELSKNTTPTARADATAYVKNNRIEVDGQVYRCTTAGTTDVSAPTFNTGIAETTTDGTVVWTEDSGNDGALNVPAALKYACLIQADFEVRNKTIRGTNSITTPDGTFGMEPRSDLLFEVRRKLRPFRKSPSVR